MLKDLLVKSTLLLVALVLVSCTPSTELVEELELPPTNTASPEVPPLESTPEVLEEPLPSQTKLVVFEQIGISLQVPQDLQVVKDPSVKLDDPSKLVSYLFYIQNSGPKDGPAEDSFQIYGRLQYSTPAVVWEEFASDVFASDIYSYVEEIEINGLKGLETQLAGERNRFVYLFSLDGLVLNIAVSEPTADNKILADEIISSLEYTARALTDASGIQEVRDPQGYYQMYLPDDWKVEFSAPTGIRLAGLVASSPGAEVIVQENDGSQAEVYYKQGSFLSIAVLDDDSALSEPMQAQISRKIPIMIAGIAGTDYIFTEPSTVEGEIREVHFYHDGLSYLVRFSYAPNAEREAIDWLVRNFLISQ